MTLIIKMIHGRIHLVILTISINVVSILISLWWNSQISYIINTINKNHAIREVKVYVAILTILLSSIIAYLLSILSTWTCETLTHDLRMGYANHTNALSIKEIERMNAGEQLSKLQNEVAEVSDYLRMNLFAFLDECIRFSLTFIWMLWLNPKLTIYAHIPIIFILFYIVLSSKILEGFTHKTQEANEKMCQSLDILINVFPIIRIYQASVLIQRNYNRNLKEWECLSIKEEQAKAKYMSLSALLSCIPLTLLVLTMGSEVIKGKMTIGTFYIFINLSGNVSGIMMNMPGRIATFRRFIANMNRMKGNVNIIKGGF